MYINLQKLIIIFETKLRQAFVLTKKDEESLRFKHLAKHRYSSIYTPTLYKSR